MISKYSFLILFLTSFFTVAEKINDEHEISAVLNAFHKAAADAQMKTYFSLMTDKAVFLGTDASERWTKVEFKKYVEPSFSKGNGWTYIPKQRNISLIKNKQVAFFDELLANKHFGLCRGTGVVVKTANGWKISQYNLSVPLPNAIVKDVAKQIEHLKKTTNKQ